MLLVTQQAQPLSIQYLPNSQCTEIFKETNKPTVLNSSAVRYTGSLKFFDENKGFGFITRDVDVADIFLHSDDLLKANLDLKFAMEIKAGKTLRMSFCVLEYLGKYNRSKKAIDIKLIEYEN
jgi:cold shock CspA family protein